MNSVERTFAAYGEVVEVTVSCETRPYRDCSFYEDMLQEVHVKLLLKLDCFDIARGSNKAYVRSLVRSTIVSFLRSQKKHTQNIVVDVSVDDIAGLAQSEEGSERMERFLARLDDTQRKAIDLRLAGRGYRVIAKELGVSVGHAHRMLGELASLYREAA